MHIICTVIIHGAKDDFWHLGGGISPPPNPPMLKIQDSVDPPSGILTPKCNMEMFALVSRLYCIPTDYWMLHICLFEIITYQQQFTPGRPFIIRSSWQRKTTWAIQRTHSWTVKCKMADGRHLDNRRVSINKNLAIANRSRVSCAHNASRASPWPWNLR